MTQRSTPITTIIRITHTSTLYHCGLQLLQPGYYVHQHDGQAEASSSTSYQAHLLSPTNAPIDHDVNFYDPSTNLYAAVAVNPMPWHIPSYPQVQIPPHLIYDQQSASYQLYGNINLPTFMHPLDPTPTVQPQIVSVQPHYPSSNIGAFLPDFHHPILSINGDVLLPPGAEDEGFRELVTDAVVPSDAKDEILVEPIAGTQNLEDDATFHFYRGLSDRRGRKIITKHALNVAALMEEEDRVSLAEEKLKEAAKKKMGEEWGATWVSHNSGLLYMTLSAPCKDIMATCRKHASNLIIDGFDLCLSIWLEGSESAHQEAMIAELLDNLNFPPKFLMGLSTDNEWYFLESKVVLTSFWKLFALSASDIPAVLAANIHTELRYSYSVSDVRPWIGRNVKNFEQCGADKMLKQLLELCIDPPQSLPPSQKSVLLGTSLEAVLHLCNGSGVGKKSTRKPTQDHKNFQWMQAQTTLELKCPKDRLPHLPSTYNKDYVVPTVLYMDYAKDMNVSAQPTDSTPATGPAQTSYKKSNEFAAVSPGSVALAPGYLTNHHVHSPLSNLGAAAINHAECTTVEEVTCPSQLSTDIELSVLPADLKESADFGVPESEQTLESDSETLHFDWTSDSGEVDDEPGGIEGYETLDGTLKDGTAPSNSEITCQRSDSAPPNLPSSASLILTTPVLRYQCIFGAKVDTPTGGLRSNDEERQSRGEEEEEEEKKKKKKNKEPKKLHPVVQNGLYVAEMFTAHIACQHVISFIVNNNIIYLWWFDHQHTIQCAGINFIQDLPHFVVLLFIMKSNTLSALPQRSHFRNKSTKFVAKLFWPEEARVTSTLYVLPSVLFPLPTLSLPPRSSLWPL
ncbi:hypothetical protein EV702DRAFT_1202146 [Suillus placidus]|uniref:Uncharacterized protein n=1 Tax=Suillus placidus TaxID=48579 RepID=A0A9P6ZLC6_9AGAM|nr:hypothetical protein EV702DRAFT_1202146 [Suillus placidus]